MNFEQNNYSDESNLKVSKDVIATLASTAACDVPGVASVAQTAAGRLRRLIGKQGESGGVTVEFENGLAAVEISVVVRYGVKVPEVARAVQEQVKEAIETAGIAVGKVDVIVADMKLETENKKTK